MSKLKQKRSTVVLKLAVFMLGLLVFVLCVFLLPIGIRESSWSDYRPLLIGMYIPAIPFYLGLIHTYKLLVLIDTQKAFSIKSIQSLEVIKYCGIIIGGLYFIAMPSIFRLADSDDAPGVVLLGLIFAGAPLIASVFAAILKTMFKNALAIKSENELTV